MPRLISLAWAVGWLGLMLVYSPVADRLASRWFAKPPTLGAFRGLQQSRLKLLVGIVIAWLLGALLEEWVFRGIVLRVIEQALARHIPAVAAAALAVLVAALGAGTCHFYQGTRAVAIVTQLSALFGVLYLLSGHDLSAVVLCHGFYDTIAFVRFASGKSKYSQLPPNEPSASSHRR